MLAILLAMAVQAAPAPASPPPQVMVTIKPVHSLVAMVMQGIAEPRLLIGSGASPHTYSLRPSDARALQQADIVFWVGERLETFLEKPLQTLSQHAQIVELAEAPGVTLLPLRNSAKWEPHDHRSHHAEERGEHRSSQPGDHHEDHGGGDLHIWLDIDNAQAIVRAAAATLIETDPANADRYRGNAETSRDLLRALDGDLRQTLAPVSGRPYVVFHDAYQYLEHRYGLTPVGSITVSPDRQPSAQRVAAIRETIAKSDAICLFSEPQFDPKLVPTLAEGNQLRIGVLDGDGGIAIPAGVDAYPEIMRSLAGALRLCLDPSS